MAVQTSAVRPGTAGRTTRRSGWTTGRWLTTGVIAALAVLLSLGVLGGWVLARASSVTDTMVNRSSPPC